MKMHESLQFYDPGATVISAPRRLATVGALAFDAADPIRHTQ